MSIQAQSSLRKGDGSWAADQANPYQPLSCDTCEVVSVAHLGRRVHSCIRRTSAILWKYLQPPHKQHTFTNENIRLSQKTEKTIVDLKNQKDFSEKTARPFQYNADESEKINLIRKYLTLVTDTAFDNLNAPDALENLGASNQVLFLVDHREYDDEIVLLCEEILKTGDLSAEYVDADDEMGVDVVIDFKGTKTRIPYEGEGSDRDTTLTTLNEVLQPDYELRLCQHSVGSDTLGFLPLTTQEWKKLEEEFKEDVGKYFVKLEKGKQIFY